MLKQLRSSICIAFLIAVLVFSSPAIAQNEEAMHAMKIAQQTNYVQQDIKVNDLDIEPINTQEVKKTVVPDVKKEGKKVFNDFLKVMGLVLLSSVIIYVILLFVKKFYGSAFVEQNDDEYMDALDLSTPDNRPDALKSFLNRTK